MADARPDGARGEDPEINLSGGASYRLRAAATLREACEASGRTLGRLAAALSERFERHIGVDELKGWLAGECEFPIAAVAAVTELGPPSPAPEPDAKPVPSPWRRIRARRPLAVGVAAGALLALGGIVAQAMSAPQPQGQALRGGSGQRHAVTTWSSPAPAPSQAPQRVVLTGGTPEPTVAADTHHDPGTLSASQVGTGRKAPAPVTHGSRQPASQGGTRTPANATPSPSPSASPSGRPTPGAPSSPSPEAPAGAQPTPTPTPSHAASPSVAASSSDPSQQGGGIITGLLGLLLG